MKQNEPHQKVYHRRRDIIANNFLGGVAWGIGSVIGATVVIGILGIIISQTRTVPFLGQIVETTINEIEKQRGKPLFER